MIPGVCSVCQHTEDPGLAELPLQGAPRMSCVRVFSATALQSLLPEFPQPPYNKESLWHPLAPAPMLSSQGFIPSSSADSSPLQGEGLGLESAAATSSRDMKRGLLSVFLRSLEK